MDSHFPAYPHWQKIGIKPHRGLVIPLFSLRTKNSHGIGEFLDLIPVIDWMSELGLDVLQLLPINDTHGSPSPYDTFSSFALNPIYISLQGHPAPRLNALKHVPYENIWISKREILQHKYLEEKGELFKTPEYQQFRDENRWLNAYVSFYDGDEFFIWLQYIAFHQMAEVKKHAEKKGVLLKGDIPILLTKSSVDVRSNPELFDMSLSVGSPPDQYTTEGQNWGFPLYRWEENFDGVMRWWEERLKFKEKLYHLYRLDHAVGVFRMWAIPDGRLATDGFFIPQDVTKWTPLGEEVLKRFLQASTMLPIAEDLGVIPPSATETFARLGIPGTKVVRWMHREGRYLEKERYPEISMTTLSTHDTETVGQWWVRCPNEAEAFSEVLGIPYTQALTKEMRREILRFSEETKSLFHINILGEWLALFDDQVWPHEEDERINNPANLSRPNWRYRFKKPFEEIASDDRLKRLLTE